MHVCCLCGHVCDGGLLAWVLKVVCGVLEEIKGRLYLTNLKKLYCSIQFAATQCDVT